MAIQGRPGIPIQPLMVNMYFFVIEKESRQFCPLKSRLHGRFTVMTNKIVFTIKIIMMKIFLVVLVDHFRLKPCTAFHFKV